MITSSDAILPTRRVNGVRILHVCRYVMCDCRSSSQKKAEVSAVRWLRSSDIASASRYSGYLYQHRATKLITNRPRRFCVLRNTDFLCYKSDKDFARPLLCLPVGCDGYDVVYRRTAERPGRQLTHELHFYRLAADSHVFSADTERLARRWAQVYISTLTASTCVSRYQNVSIRDFIGAKDDGGGEW